MRNKSSERGNLKKKPFDIFSIWNDGKVGGMTQWELMKCTWQNEN